MPGFCRTSNQLIQSGALDRLSLCATRVYRRMEWLADRCGRCYPGLVRLAGWVGFCVRSVTQAMRELVSAGLVARMRRGGKGRSTVYQLTRMVADEPAPMSDDLPLFSEKNSQLPQANPVSVSTSSRALRLPTTQTCSTQTQHNNNAQGVTGVVVSLPDAKGATAEIMARTDAPRERAEAMAREYPEAKIREKLALLAKAKGVRSTGAWLSAALARDYRGKGAPAQTPEEIAERKRRADVRRATAVADAEQKQRAYVAKLRGMEGQQASAPLGRMLSRELGVKPTLIPVDTASFEQRRARTLEQLDALAAGGAR